MDPAPIHIVLSSSNEYAPYCATTIVSILQNIDKKRFVYFYIISYDFSPQNIKKFKKLKGKNCSIEFPPFDRRLLQQFNEINLPGHVTEMTYARILIPNIIPQVDKAIFIDCDILVRNDISKLYDHPLSDECFAAVPDACSEYHAKRLWGEISQLYYNCGVLLINARKLRQINYLSLIEEKCRLRGKNYNICDQDVLNDTFRGKILPLSITWNFHHEKFIKMGLYKPSSMDFYKKVLNNPFLVHYTGAAKPWYPTSDVVYKKEYLYCYRRTPFYEKLKFQRYIIENKEFLVLSFMDKPLCVRVREKSTENQKKKAVLNNQKIPKNKRASIFSFDEKDGVYRFLFLGKTILKKIDLQQLHEIQFIKIPLYRKSQTPQEITLENKAFELLKLQNGKLDRLTELLTEQKVINKKLIEQVGNLKCILEALRIHPRTFSKYRNAFDGREVVLVCTGPTALQYKPIADAIHVGVNGAIYLENVGLDFLFLQDYTINQKGNGTLNDDANAYKGNNCKKFYGIIPDIHLATLKSVIERIPYRMYSQKGVAPYIIEDIVCHNLAQDLSREPIGNFLGTPFSALQFILYGNPKTIYLVGWDCNSGYAYGKENAINPANYQIDIIKNYIIPHLSKNYPHIKIKSINPVGLRGFFEDIEL